MSRTFFTRRSVAAVLASALVLASGSASADESAPVELPKDQHFTVDPVVDGLLVTGGITFSELLGLILSTGEIRPLPPGDPAKLSSFDRVAVTQTIDPNAGTRSNYGLWAAYGYAVLDTALTGVSSGRRALLVEGVMYAESIALTAAFTNATKIGVRRPRPLDYAMCYNVDPNTPGCQSTDLQLSFFSGHASATGAASGTATYLAFMRDGPRKARPWITLGVGTLVTAFVSYERVRSGYHFPTDVVMGSLAGAGIGVLVPHFHRKPHYHESEYCAPPVIIGFAPTPDGKGAVTLTGRF